MNSSVKFFAPSVIDGLPLPGFVAADVDPLLDSELLSLLDPQAARPIASATARRATHPLYHVRPVISACLHFVLCRLEHGALGLYPTSPAQPPRRRESLQQGKESVRREGESRD